MASLKVHFNLNYEPKLLNVMKIKNVPIGLVLVIAGLTVLTG